MISILSKRSATAGVVPTSSQLTAGETAVNTADAYLYAKHTDGAIKRIGTTSDSVQITAVGSIPGGSLQGALAAIDEGFAPLSSPVFTGNPKSVTPADGDNDTSIATTAFVQSAVNSIGSRIITASSSFTVPAATTRIYVSLVGGGGGGAGSLDIAPYAGGGGGAGGVVYRKAIAVTPGQAVAVTIGTGGAGGRGLNDIATNTPLSPIGTYATSNGTAGTVTSFGALASTSGGGGGYCQAGHSRGGAAGSAAFCSDGKSGDVLATTHTEAGGDGGGNVFSAPSPGGHDGDKTGTLYGGGGCGGRATTYWVSGQAGAPGLCIVEW